jgi:putative nucleotidyltransferase with HDIG domain
MAARAFSREAPWESFLTHEPGLTAHCKRVAFLATLISDRLNLPLGTRRDVEAAAFLHHVTILNLSDRAFRRLAGDLGLKMPAAPASRNGDFERVAAILRGRNENGRGDPSTCSEIIEACDRFDETVEFAPYEGISISEAITQFREAVQEGVFPGDAASQLTVISKFDGRRGVPGERLPVIPRHTKQLLTLREDEITVSDLETIAGSDPALAGALIQSANSVQHGRMSESTTIRHAIVYLGIATTRRTLLRASFQNLFASAGLNSIWKHSMAVASLVRELARTKTEIAPEEAYLAGLVHDVGRLAITTFPSEPRVLEAQFCEGGFPAVYAESLAYQADHAELGAKLLQLWKFPRAIVDAVRFHHNPPVGGSQLACLLYLAEEHLQASAYTEHLPSLLRLERAEQGAGFELEDIPEDGNEDRQLAV